MTSAGSVNNVENRYIFGEREYKLPSLIFFKVLVISYRFFNIFFYKKPRKVKRISTVIQIQFFLNTTTHAAVVNSDTLLSVFWTTENDMLLLFTVIPCRQCSVKNNMLLLARCCCC